jgi:hypothetical protein
MPCKRPVSLVSVYAPCGARSGCLPTGVTKETETFLDICSENAKTTREETWVAYYIMQG